MAQDDKLAISSWQRTHHAFNFYSPFFTFALLFRAESRAFQRQVVIVSFSAVDQRAFAAEIPAEVIDGGVMRNLVNPGGELKLRPVPRQRAIDLDKNFLR